MNYRHLDHLRRLVEDEGHRAVVHQFDLHHRTESSRLHHEPQTPQVGDEALVELLRHEGIGGLVKARPAPLAPVRSEGELTHDEQRALDLRARDELEDA